MKKGKRKKVIFLMENEHDRTAKFKADISFFG